MSPNPRKFKRVINLTNFLFYVNKKNNICNNNSLLVTLSILSIQYPYLLGIIKEDPKVYFELSLLAKNFQDYENIKKMQEIINEIDYKNELQNQHPKAIQTTNKNYSVKDLSKFTILGLRYISKNNFAFGLMRQIGENKLYTDKELSDLRQQYCNELDELLRLLKSSLFF